MIKRPAIIVALMTMAIPAWATCEMPKMPFTNEQLIKNPGLGASWTDQALAAQAECRRKEEAVTKAQEQEDIHAIRRALEEIARRIGKQ